MAELPPRLKESLASSKASYRQLGKSGLRISVPIFGCMSFGDKRTLPWVIEEDEVCLHMFTGIYGWLLG